MQKFWFILCAACVAASSLAQTLNVGDTTIVQPGPAKTWPAGPYSQLITNYGIMATTIPLVNLKGKGDTSLELSLTHRTASNGNLPGDYALGKAWSHSGVSYLNTTNGIVRYIGNRAVAKWTFNSSIFDRKPGVRDDLTQISGGYKVVDFASKISYYYDRGANPFYYLTKAVDVYGNQITYSYVGSTNNLFRITDASGRYIEFTYDTTYPTRVNRIHLQTAGSSREWDMAYVTLSNGVSTLPNYLDQITFPSPDSSTRPTIQFDTDTAGRITFLRTLSGKLWNYTYGTSYSGFQGLTKICQPSKTSPTTIDTTHVTTFTYGLTGAGGGANDEIFCRITDPMGFVTVHNYWNYTGGQSTVDFPFPIKRINDPSVTRYLDPRNSQNPVTWNWWETYHWRTTDATCDVFTDREGVVTNYTYDVNNRGLVATKTTVNQGVNFTDTYSYYTASAPYNGKVSQHIDPFGTVTNYNYFNATGALANVVLDPTGQNIVQNYHYNATGQLDEGWMASDPHTVYSNFDAYGNPRTIASPATGTTTYTFDDYNNMTSKVEPAPKGTTTFTYDAWNRLLRTTFPDNQYLQNGYDAESNIVDRRMEDGSHRTTTYNFLNLPSVEVTPVDSIGANNLTTTTDYDYNGRRTTVTAPDGLVTSFLYNQRGDLIKVSYSDGTNRQWGYNGNGDVVWRQNGRNQITYYVYDGLSRMTTIDYQTTTPDVTYTYRMDGLRASRADAVGTTVWTYNDAKQLTNLFDAATNKNLTFTYKTGTNRPSTVVAPGNTWSYFYDSNTRPWYVVQSVSGEMERNAAFNADGSVARKEYVNNTKKEFTYDARGRITGIRHAVTSLDLLQEQIGYVYTNGNVSQYTLSINNGPSYSTTYSHDFANRLLQEIRTDSTSVNGFNKAYVYTKGGDRSSTTKNSILSSYTYFSGTNRLKTGEGFTVTAYDNDGNPTAISVPGSGNWTLAYDEDSRLTQITKPGGNVKFTYDGDGQRVQRTTSTSTYRYLLHGGDLILTSSTAPSYTIQAYYTPGVGYFQGGAVYYSQENALGSALVVRNTSGDWMSLTEYDAYGGAYNVNGSLKSDFRFAGAWGYVTDDASGMNFVGSRYYLPVLGRFLTQNQGALTVGLNLYSYCDNNPLGRVEPDGKEPILGRYTLHWPTAFSLPISKPRVDAGRKLGWALTPPRK